MYHEIWLVLLFWYQNQKTKVILFCYMIIFWYFHNIACSKKSRQDWFFAYIVFGISMCEKPVFCLPKNQFLLCGKTSFLVPFSLVGRGRLHFVLALMLAVQGWAIPINPQTASTKCLLSAFFRLAWGLKGVASANSHATKDCPCLSN